MTRFSRFGTDYTDPSAYSGTAGSLSPRRPGHVRPAGGMLVRGVGAVLLGILAIVLAWHLIGLLIGTVFLVLKVALVVGIVAALVAAFRLFR